MLGFGGSVDIDGGGGFGSVDLAGERTGVAGEEKGLVGRFDFVGEKTGVEGEEILLVGNRILGGEEEGNAGGFEGFTKNAGFVNEE